MAATALLGSPLRLAPPVKPARRFGWRSRGDMSPPGSQAVKHCGDAIEHCVARLNVVGRDVSPGNRDAECRASFARGAERSGEPSDAIAAAAAIAFRKVQRDGAKRPP